MKKLNTILSVVNSQNIALVVVVCILIGIILILLGWLIVKFINRNENNSPRELTQVIKTSPVLDKEQEELKKTRQLLISKLENVSNLSKEEAKNLLVKEMENELSVYINQEIKKANTEINSSKEKYAQQIIVDAMENLAESVVADKTTYRIELPDEKIKGYVIGKNGKNKKFFEAITGVEIVIEKETAITLSSANSKKRELAKMVMERLLTKSIDPIRISKIYNEQKLLFDKRVYENGRKVVEDELQIFDLNKDLYQYIGKLNFRTSFSQNVLTHSKEVAQVCAYVASELKLDLIKAKKIGLLHDIGKSIDNEIDNDHVTQGVKLAKQFGCDEDTINAIESHHEKVSCNNIYSWILKVADTISASRPGVRTQSLDDYLKRANEMEKICYSFKAVNEAHVYRAGRAILVYVDPYFVKENEYEKLAYDIKKALEQNQITNCFQIEITINRVNSLTIKTTSKIK